MKEIKISIAGGSGRMGKALMTLVLEKENLVLSSASCMPSEPEDGLDLGIISGKKKLNKYLTSNRNDLFYDTDVLIDFTVPENTLENVQLASKHNIPIVIGTTGFTNEQMSKLKYYSKNITIVYSANFSVGISVMESLINDAVKKLGDLWDIEILETHHNKKIDSPSGTALMLGKVAASARKKNLDDVKNISRNGITNKRNPEEIGFAVLRGGDVVGEHSIRFYNNNERIEINHIATNRSIFAQGALRSAIWSINKKPGFYNLKDVLNKN